VRRKIPYLDGAKYGVDRKETEREERVSREGSSKALDIEEHRISALVENGDGGVRTYTFRDLRGERV
jgi:hypothetical protein